MISKLLGIETSHVSHTERLISGLGGLSAILCIFAITQYLVSDDIISHILIASMGASAVLIFAVPHGPLSQPWAVFAGHIISALIGVTCSQWIAHTWVAAGVAVGLAIIAMYYLRCLHPPGGATALAAVIGGESVQQLSYQFVLTPVLINVILIILIGILFNYFFHWRRYPAALYRFKQPTDSNTIPLSHNDFVYALSQLNSFIDINEQDLLHIYNIAIHKSQEAYNMFENIEIGHYYSNGKYGKDWTIVQVTKEERHNEDPQQDKIHFKIVVGPGRRKSGEMERKAFIDWARYCVVRDEENWKKLD